MSGIDLVVVIPVLDEAAVLRELVARTRAAAVHARPRARVVIVDDASTDDTERLAPELSDDVVSFLRMPSRRGQLGATLAGLASLDASIAIVLDGDLQDPPEAIGDLVAALDGAPQADAAFAVKSERDDARWMSVASRVYGSALRRLAISPPPTGAGSYCAMRRSVVAALLASPPRVANLAPLVAAEAERWVSVEYRKAARRDGPSRVGPAGLVLEALGSLAAALRRRVAPKRAPHR